MFKPKNKSSRTEVAFIVWLLLVLSSTEARSQTLAMADAGRIGAIREPKTSANLRPEKPLVESVLPKYYNRQSGVSVVELVGRALQANGELVAARLEVEKARARLAQARLRPNPTLEVEQSSGRLIGSPNEGELSVGATLPLEVFGQRASRIKVAEIDVAAKEAEIANRERQLTADILSNYADALAALQELKVTEEQLDLDLRTARFVQIRVNEGETPPLELNQLQVEAERIRAARALSEGKLQAALTKLKLLSGTSLDEPLRLNEQVDSVTLPSIPPSVETAIEVALRTRPDVRMAQIEEDAASAGLLLARAHGRPDLAVTSRYTQGISETTIPGLGDFPDRSRTLTFGVSVTLPVFNKNQGAKAEAEIAIRQARERKRFAEAIVRSEVTAAFLRAQAAQRSLAILQTAVVPRSQQNVTTVRAVYELGEIKITDLIAEQRRLLDANKDLTDALTERFRADADLIISLGTSVAPKK